MARAPERTDGCIRAWALVSLVLSVLFCSDPAGRDPERTNEPGAAPAGPDSAADSGASPAPGAAEPFVLHTVAPGQTLWDIARTYGVTVQEILDANGMTDQDIRRLSVGKPLQIPGAFELLEVETAADRARKRAELPEITDGAYHIIAPGETLWELARLYDVSADEIMIRNEIDDGDVRSFHPGQPIIIPGISPSRIKKAEQKPARRGIGHVLAPGETVWDLARRFAVSVSEIMAANRLDEQAVVRLRHGQKVLIPGVERDTKGKVRRKRLAAHTRAMALAEKLGLGTRQAANLLLTGTPEPEWIEAAGGKEDRFAGRLRWPVTNGWFVRGYGSGQDGYHLAVDIAGKIGWNVRAVAPGIVGYSGDQVKGYGNIVMVIHPGGWVTTYAHNSVNFAVAGQKVERGAILAELGSTGISRGPHVHFEFLYKGEMCDPNPLFKPGVRHRTGKLSPLKYTSWTTPKKRPKQVRCAKRRRHPSAMRVDQETAEPQE